MKVQITVKSVKRDQSWTEDYDVLSVKTQPEAATWALELIKRFNESCHPGESHRELLQADLVGESMQHDWYKRTDGMSVRFRNQLVDIFECRNCGITGKRFGLGGSIKRDYKWRAKKHDKCAMERIA